MPYCFRGGAPRGSALEYSSESLAVTGRADYLTGEGVTGDLPRSDVLEFRLEHGKVIVRPSGTEPKLKIYLSASAETMAQAEAANQLVLQELRSGWLH